MHATRRQWMVVSFGLSFSVLAVLLDRPALVFGTMGVTCWVLYRYVSFASELRRDVAGTTVSQSCPRIHVRADIPISVTVDVERPPDSSLSLSAESRPPLSGHGAAREERTANLDVGETTARTTYSVAFPTAGSASFETPIVEASDRFGLFTARWTGDDGPKLMVTQRTPSDVHVGRGGKRTQTQYGGQSAKRNTSGLPTVEIREYTTGDSLRRVDWNATARFNYPHVREYEKDPDQRVAVFIDRRSSVGNGRPGETQLAYLREVALALVAEAHDRSDSLGLFAVGREGVTAGYPFRSTPTHYEAIRETLRSLEVEGGRTRGNDAETTPRRISDAVSSRRRDSLRADDSAFAARIRPFLSDASRGAPADAPLRSTVERQLSRQAGNVSVVLLTSDAHRAEVRDCVRYASREAGQTNVFLAPRVLFDSTGLADLDETYGRYVSFERFRRKIGSYPLVSAFEVGPGDRVETILSSARGVSV